MKNVITFKVLIGVIAFTILGCGGTDGVDEEIDVVAPAQFVSADPPNGAVLLPKMTTITVLFDSNPRDLRVIREGLNCNGFTIKFADKTVTITGNFPLGELTLVLRWQTEEYTLVYTVQDEVALIPDSEFEMGSDVNTDEKPIHTIFVDSFYMDIHEVTVPECRHFIQEAGHPPPDLEGEKSLYRLVFLQALLFWNSNDQRYVQDFLNGRCSQIYTYI